jgi:hypothetical protein
VSRNGIEVIATVSRWTTSDVSLEVDKFSGWSARVRCEWAATRTDIHATTCQAFLPLDPQFSHYFFPEISYEFQHTFFT